MSSEFNRTIYDNINDEVVRSDDEYVCFSGFRRIRHLIYKFPDYNPEKEEFDNFVEREILNNGYLA